MEIERWKWVLNARHLYVWDKNTLADYVKVLQEVVYSIMKDREYLPEDLRRLGSPEIGFLNLVDEQVPEKPLVGYALYVADVRLPYDKRRTLFSEFKGRYQIHVGGGEAARFLSDEDSLREMFPDRAENIIQRKRELAGLAKNFMTLANKSINHCRSINKRLRYQVFERDNYTCQSCGRKAPNVRLHVDHIKPVSWDLEYWETGLKVSDNPDDYQTLCEDCNLGKGNLSWLLIGS